MPASDLLVTVGPIVLLALIVVAWLALWLKTMRSRPSDAASAPKSDPAGIDVPVRSLRASRPRTPAALAITVAFSIGAAYLRHQRQEREAAQQSKIEQQMILEMTRQVAQDHARIEAQEEADREAVAKNGVDAGAPIGATCAWIDPSTGKRCAQPAAVLPWGRWYCRRHRVGQRVVPASHNKAASP